MFAKGPVDAAQARRRSGEGPARVHQAGQGKPPDAPQGIHRCGHQAVPGHPGLLQDRSAQGHRVRNGEAKTKFQAEWSKAVAALEEYQKFLQGDLLAKSTGSFRMGEAHQRLLQLTTLGNIPLNDLQAQAQADYKNIRNTMVLLSAQFYKIMDPKFNVDTVQNVPVEQLINNVVPHVFDRIKTEQPAKTEVADRINAAVAEIKAFIDKTKIIDLPADPFVA